MFSTELTLFSHSSSSDTPEHKRDTISALAAKEIDKNLLQEIERIFVEVKQMITHVSALPGKEKNAELVDRARKMINASIITHLKSRATSLTEKLLLRVLINSLKIQKAGNCKEHALYGYWALTERKIKCEIFRIDNGDHIFLVVNRDPSTSAHDYMSWNPSTYVVDPFFSQVYSSKEIPLLLKSCTFNQESNEISYSHFDPKKHVLVNTVMQDLLKEWQENLKFAAGITTESNDPKMGCDDNVAKFKLN